MNSAILNELNTARQSKQAVVLMTGLKSEQQYLFFADSRGDDCPFGTEGIDKARIVLGSDRAQICELNGEEVFLQAFNPPLRMIVVGAVHIAQALIPMASLAGYAVTVIDPRQAFASEDRFPGVELKTDWPDAAMRELSPDNRTAIVTLTHDPKLDDPALEVALRSPAFYIGSLGSNKTQQGRHDRLTEKGFTEAEQSRINGPIGLDIGAKSPAEIAVSIMAEITQALRQS